MAAAREEEDMEVDDPPQKGTFQLKLSYFVLFILKTKLAEEGPHINTSSIP